MRQIIQEAERLDKELEVKLKESGMQINQADIQAFIEASKPIYDEFVADVPNGKVLLEKTQTAIK